MSDPPVLLLDVMDTLVYDPYRQIPAFLGMPLQELLAVKDRTAWIEFERGELTEEQYFHRFFADGRSFDHRGLKEEMRRGYRWLEGMEELLAELAGKGLEIHALSNYSSWYRMIEDRLGLSRYLRWSFVSCHTGVRKPSPEAYLGAAESLGRPPAECVFVDDREGNCAAAAEVGMVAMQFDGYAGLRSRLQHLGLL